ncbi:MAG: ROK family protein [bacterium]
MSKYAIGINIGGTKIIAGVVDKEQGKVIGFHKIDTAHVKGSDSVLVKVIDSAERAICQAGVPYSQIGSIGIGVAGQVDRKYGILLSSPNLDCYNLELKFILEEHFDLPVYVGNDTEAITLGEMKYGSGTDFDNFVCVFVGTGIGSGIVYNRKILQGATGTAGEVGHMIVHSGGRQCSCGNNGCLEAYASRHAIEEKLLASIKKGHKSAIQYVMSDDKSLKSEDIVFAINHNDELVINSITEASEYLSSGLASVINFYNPQAIILSGSIINDVDLYFDLTVKKTLAKSLPASAGSVKILKAQLDDMAGVVGASLFTEV